MLQSTNAPCGCHPTRRCSRPLRARDHWLFDTFAARSRRLNANPLGGCPIRAVHRFNVVEAQPVKFDCVVLAPISAICRYDIMAYGYTLQHWHMQGVGTSTPPPKNTSCTMRTVVSCYHMWAAA